MPPPLSVLKIYASEICLPPYLVVGKICRMAYKLTSATTGRYRPLAVFLQICDQHSASAFWIAPNLIEYVGHIAVFRVWIDLAIRHQPVLFILMKGLLLIVRLSAEHS